MTKGDLIDFLQPFTEEIKIQIECYENDPEDAFKARYELKDGKGVIIITMNEHP